MPIARLHYSPETAPSARPFRMLLLVPKTIRFRSTDTIVEYVALGKHGKLDRGRRRRCHSFEGRGGGTLVECQR